MKFYGPALLIFSLVLASCAPPPEEPDWCYTFDFADYTGLSDKINVEAGTWNAGTGGILADGAGYIILNWSEDFFVHQVNTQVFFTRFGSDPAPLDISAVANVFGHHIGFTTTLPALLGVPEDETVQADYATDRPSTDVDDTNTASLTLNVNRLFRLDKLYLTGDGVSPFPDNPCGPQTPTPPPSATYTLAPTSTATNTATSTRTPTPTGTLSMCWVMEYDFVTSNHSVTISQGVWTSGQGLVSIAAHPSGFLWNRALSFRDDGPSQPVTVSRVDIHQTHVLGENPSNFKIEFVNPPIGQPLYAIYDEPISEGVISWQGTPTATRWIGATFTAGEDIGVLGDPATDPGGSIVISKMIIWGTGALPGSDWTGTKTALPCHDFTPTPTPTASATTFTNTPTPTRTWTPFPVTNPPTAIATRTPLVVASPTRSNTPVPSSTPISTSTPEPTLTFPPPTITNTPGPTIPASPTYTTATGFPLITYLPPGYTPTYGGTGIPGLGGTTIWGTPDGTFTPIPSLELIPTLDSGTQYHSDIYNGLGTAAANINGLPSNINSQLPSIDANFGVFSGYARWAMSSVSLQEVLGQKFYPIGQHIFIWVGIVLFWNGAQLAIRIAVLLIKVFVWVFHQILKFIPFMG